MDEERLVSLSEDKDDIDNLQTRPQALDDFAGQRSV